MDTHYSPLVGALIHSASPMPLDMGAPSASARHKLAALSPEQLFARPGTPIRDMRMAQCCLAGLWLRHGFYDESHVISQDIETPTGGFWHAIVHRREPDYGNARYWFRRVGSHPIFPDLNNAAIAAGWPDSALWDAKHFVDKVENVMRVGKTHENHALCIAVQEIEWRLLFDYSWKNSL